MPVPVGPKGVPADYVPFSFAPRSPMLYVIDKGGIPEYGEGQDPLVHLVTDVDTIIRKQLLYVSATATAPAPSQSISMTSIDWIESTGN